MFKRLWNYRRNRNQHYKVIRVLRHISKGKFIAAKDEADWQVSRYFGLCSNACHYHPVLELHKFAHLWTHWPEYSGKLSRPVKGSVHSLQNDQYIGEHGKARRELAAFLADELEARTHRILLWGRV